MDEKFIATAIPSNLLDLTDRNINLPFIQMATVEI